MIKVPNCIQKGSGSPTHYKYWTGGVKLLTKRAILKAITLKLRILRKDKITNLVEVFNYKSQEFDGVDFHG